MFLKRIAFRITNTGDNCETIEVDDEMASRIIQVDWSGPWAMVTVMTEERGF